MQSLLRFATAPVQSSSPTLPRPESLSCPEPLSHADEETWFELAERGASIEEAALIKRCWPKTARQALQAAHNRILEARPEDEDEEFCDRENGILAVAAQACGCRLPDMDVPVIALKLTKMQREYGDPDALVVSWTGLFERMAA